MCELFAHNSRDPLATNAYLAEFFDHSHRHPHGWGLMWRDEASDKSVVLREPVAAHESTTLPRVLERPLSTRHLLAHIRRSTCGAQVRENCHPFQGTDITGTEWSMIHNGILYNEELLIGNDLREAGETDSERALLFFLDVLDEAALRAGGVLDFEGRFEALAGAVRQAANFNRLNVILDDGEFTYVHTNTSETTLWQRELAGAVVFSTQPLGSDGERDEWRPVPPNRLIAYRDGRLVRTSAPHGYVFCEAILELRRIFGEDWQTMVA